MDVPQLISDLTSHFSTLTADAEKFAADHLPLLNGLAQAAGNPLVQAVLRAAHVSPEIFSGMAAVIDKLDADLAAAEQARQAAEAAASPAPPAA